MTEGLTALVVQATSALMPHLMLAPIALPLLTAALMLLMREERQRLKLTLNVLSTTLGLLVPLALLLWSNQPRASSSLGV
jgi:multicomponent K+:H+ antiporter subunit D